MFHKLKIYPYISTRTHCFHNNSSVSLIYDADKKLYYLLKGVSSILWNLIIEYQDLDKLKLFALNNCMQNELDSLLFELKENKIINTNIMFKESSNKHLANAISIKSPNFGYFYNEWIKYLYSHGNLNTLYLDLNYKCNLKCKHCYNHKNMDKYYISFNQAKKAIDQAYDMGISLVKITGGECTLNKDFLKIVKYIRSKYLELHISTNGQILNDHKKFLLDFLSLYPSEIRISLYSMNPEIHDYITGIKGSWEKTVNVIKKMKEANVNVVISTPILSYNKDCYKKVFEFADSMGIKCTNNCIFINNPENNNLSSKLDIKDIEQYYMYKLNKEGSIKTKKFEKNDEAVCEAGWERLCITPKLDIIPCVAMEYYLGNLKSNTLAEVKETTLVDFKKKFIKRNLTECFNEEYCKYCMYCSDTACFNNTFMKKQPISCENAKARYNAFLFYKNKEK